MSDTTVAGGGGGTPGHQGFHVYGNGEGHRAGGPVSPGITGHDHGLRGFGNGSWAANHGHFSGATGGPGGHRFGGHSSGQQHQGGLGHDTINLGSGHDTLVDAGRAAGTHFGYHVSTHSATMAGGAHHTNFISGAHALISHGGAGHDTAGGASHLTAHLATHALGTDVIKNFVSGHDKLYLEGKHLSYLHSRVDVTVSHGATHISLDGGHTTIALKGFSHIDTMGHK
jgi:hypothetical protein